MRWWLHGIYIVTIAAVLLIGVLFMRSEPITDRVPEQARDRADVPVTQPWERPEPVATTDNKRVLTTNPEEGAPEVVPHPETRELTEQTIHQRQQAEIEQRIDRLEVLFHREPMDQGWALQQEQNVRDMFILNEKLRDFAVNSVDCRKTLCRIEMAATDADSLTTMMTIQRTLIQQDWHPQEAQTYLRNADEHGFNYTLFIER